MYGRFKAHMDSELRQIRERNPGARISWLMPLPFYSELFVSVQNSQGAPDSSDAAKTITCC